MGNYTPDLKVWGMTLYPKHKKKIKTSFWPLHFGVTINLVPTF